jgi:hypothetical protein
MIEVELTHAFPVSVDEAFSYITDTRNWVEYWPDFVRIEDPESVAWDAPGDSVTVVVKLLGREVGLDLTLEEFERNSVVRYTSRQHRLPPARHERRFSPAPDGFVYRLSVSFEPRTGPAGLFDRFVLERAVASALRKTIENLERVFDRRQRA